MGPWSVIGIMGRFNILSPFLHQKLIPFFPNSLLWNAVDACPKRTVLRIDLSLVYFLLIKNIRWFLNWWRHKWYKEHYPSALLYARLAVKELSRCFNSKDVSTMCKVSVFGRLRLTIHGMKSTETNRMQASKDFVLCFFKDALFMYYTLKNFSGSWSKRTSSLFINSGP